jgi:hypothetical protein
MEMKIIGLKWLLHILMGSFVLPVEEVITTSCGADPKPIPEFFYMRILAFPLLSGEPAVASGILWVYANAIIPGDKVARIAAISEDVDFAVVAGCTNVIWES